MRLSASVLWAEGDRVYLRIRVTPRSASDRVEGPTGTAEGHALKVRVRAVPEDGAANDAVIAAVASWAGLPKSMVTLESGARSRVKTLRLAGDPNRLIATLNNKLAGA